MLENNANEEDGSISRLADNDQENTDLKLIMVWKTAGSIVWKTAGNMVWKTTGNMVWTTVMGWEITETGIASAQICRSQQNQSRPFRFRFYSKQWSWSWWQGDRSQTDRILRNNRHYNDDDYSHDYMNNYRPNRRSWSGKTFRVRKCLGSWLQDHSRGRQSRTLLKELVIRITGAFISNLELETNTGVSKVANQCRSHNSHLAFRRSRSSKSQDYVEMKFSYKAQSQITGFLWIGRAKGRWKRYSNWPVWFPQHPFHFTPK